MMVALVLSTLMIGASMAAAIKAPAVRSPGWCSLIPLVLSIRIPATVCVAEAAMRLALGRSGASRRRLFPLEVPGSLSRLLSLVQARAPPAWSGTFRGGRDNLGGPEVGQVVLPATPGGSPAAREWKVNVPLTRNNDLPYGFFGARGSCHGPRSVRCACFSVSHFEA